MTYGTIRPDDGFPQWTCQTCIILVDGAIKLRELSHCSEQILRLASAKNKILIEPKTKLNNADFSENLEPTCLQEELDNDFLEIVKKSIPSRNKDDESDKQKVENKTNHKTDNNGDTSKKVRKRQPMPQEKLQKYLSLAVTPYDSKGPVACLICRKELKTLRYFINHAKTHFAAEHTCRVLDSLVIVDMIVPIYPVTSLNLGDSELGLPLQDCGKKFVSPHSMRYHMMRLHGLEKRHPCQRCDFRGVDLDQLRNHVRRVHTQERPYACSACDAAFALPAGLRQHARTHGAPKTEQCDRCSAMFRSRSELAGHRRRVHGRVRADGAACATRPERTHINCL
ncbi:Zinc finger protein 782 [Eumeta japonica]|uniref:Zinc finger protein 782 n=1 Tax=Eumeta variegata TaxID=151549 RepID=A0A4C1ZPY0_EUMVA|nr:Zinc finger protein 782 [Eumeta japonica]